MKNRKFVTLFTAAVMITGLLTGCGSSQSAAASSAQSSDAVSTQSSAPAASSAAASTAAPAAASGTESAAAATTQKVTLKGIADLVPHSELIEHVKPILEKEGITIDLVSTSADTTTNEKLAKGEIDFNYFQHLPYLKEWNAANGYNLVDAGDIHIEPITAYSDKYKSTDQIPKNAVVAIPNDGTNEYRALSILEKNGFIKLDAKAASSLSASVDDIKTYVKPIKIVELDSAQIIPTKADYDFFITNTNKALEAKITSTKLFSEGSDSPYANIIAVRPEDKDKPAIQALVKALQSDDTKKFIEEKYNGAVIPAAVSSSSSTDATGSSAAESSSAESTAESGSQQ